MRRSKNAAACIRKRRHKYQPSLDRPPSSGLETRLMSSRRFGTRPSLRQNLSVCPSRTENADLCASNRPLGTIAVWPKATKSSLPGVNSQRKRDRKPKSSLTLSYCCVYRLFDSRENRPVSCGEPDSSECPHASDCCGVGAHPSARYVL